ncbi:hypothetical protein [Cochlodiniinecator piscidefendens]|uniref:hypothetical protein n=1 Tax=Cochlodiniinecator piscidefendens TaxID=2715756 RepID=UPI00140DA438|nr:hypothetical protein [Cochlodiniinecator piscidefendens]
MSEFEPFDPPRAVIVPQDFLKLLEEAEKDPDYYINNEEASSRLIRSIIAFRERNNLNQSELSMSLNIGNFGGNTVGKIERAQLSDPVYFKAALRALRDYAQATNGYVAWVDVSTDQIQHHIEKVRSSLLILVDQLANLNDDPSQPVFPSEVAKQQLIVLLKAVLQELEAPKIDKGRLSQVFSWTGKLAGRVAKKKAESTLGSALDSAMQEGTDLLDKIKDLPGSDNLF